ncbi:hypothetical protein LX36DRAFT_439446 [Colletotrichum falcatum]|nr:hypothetical protein LX36DRAFT_439446 [Colletotrichum falcatum]
MHQNQTSPVSSSLDLGDQDCVGIRTRLFPSNASYLINLIVLIYAPVCLGLVNRSLFPSTRKSLQPLEASLRPGMHPENLQLFPSHSVLSNRWGEGRGLRRGSWHQCRWS